MRNNAFDEERSGPQPRAFDPGYGQQAKSRKQENDLAKAVGGVRTPASGALAGLKGDVRHSQFLFEAKRTDGNTLPLRMDWLEKINWEASDAQKIPAMAVQFGTMPAPCPENWVLIPQEVFRRLVKEE